MTTQIFKDYSEFYQREDKAVNGVSQTFADANPGWDKEDKNEGCWNCSDCSDCSRCSRCSRCSDCSDCSRCSRCSDCSDCSDCSRCSGCSGCSDCSRCSGCSGCSDLKNAAPVSQEPSKSWFDVPVIPNIHSRVLEAAKEPNAFDMSTWHTCETTHCRAGWIVTLAGEKGKKLEQASSTLFAAMQIYHASSPIEVSPVRFFETNEVAMTDMERCANEERQHENAN